MSFYYCFAADGEQLEAIVAEVTNTPWGERHAYVLTAGDPMPRGGFDKALHVSPFMAMDQRYTWRAPGARRDAVGPDREQRRTDDTAFDATLGLKRRPLTRRSLRVTARHPAATLRMLALIYGHAVALKLKGVPVQPHPRAMTETTSHASSSRAAPARIRVGQLTVIEDGSETVFGAGAPQATVHVHAPEGLAAAGCAAAAAWAAPTRDGLWDSPDLTAVIRVAARNVAGHRRRPPAADARPRARSSAPAPRSCATRPQRSPQGHRRPLRPRQRAVRADARPDADVLVRRCSSTADATLEEASVAKLELVCEKLDLGPRDHVVEIGTGWGGFAVHAATTRGCRVTTTTISREQHDVAARARARRPASSTSSTSGSTTTATCAAPTTSSSRSR